MRTKAFLTVVYDGMFCCRLSSLALHTAGVPQHQLFRLRRLRASSLPPPLALYFSPALLLTVSYRGILDNPALQCGAGCCWREGTYAALSKKIIGTYTQMYISKLFFKKKGNDHYLVDGSIPYVPYHTNMLPSSFQESIVYILDRG